MKAPDRGVDCFVLFSGDTRADTAVGCLPFSPTHVLHDPAGAVWFAARLAYDRLTEIRAGDRHLVFVGPSGLDSDEVDRLSRRLGTAGAPAALTSAIASIAGVYHVATRFGDRIHLQGTASGTRRVYHARLRGGTVASNRADVIARLVGATIDPAGLALRMLEPVNHPLGQRTLWHGVESIAPGDRLEISDGRPRSVRWWSAPEPTRALPEAAAAVRDALTASVRAHLRGRGPVLTEISGGFDSTAVTALSLRAGAGGPVTGLTIGNKAMNSDEEWARMAAGLMPGLRHHVLPAATMPLLYADILDCDDDLDEPSVALANRATVLAMSAVAESSGADVHLSGHGGDHLFFGLPTLARDLLTRRPVAAARRMAAYRAMFGWPLGRTLAQLADRRPYCEWLVRCTEGTAMDYREPILRWGPPTAIPSWMTGEGREVVRTELARAGRTARPLRPTHGQHAAIDAIQQGSHLLRALADISVRTGPPLATPFFDDRVVEAALAATLFDRCDPWNYKPVLREAMRGVVPDPVLARTTKDTGALDVELGRRRHTVELMELWQESRLARHGLVDVDQLRRLCQQGDAEELNDGAINTTVGCELWLRSMERRDSMERGREGARR